MGWTYDGDKVKAQWQEFSTFLDHARNDQPADLGDLVGRPFRHPAPDQPDITPVVQPAPQINYYVLQIAQLYEAGAIDAHQYNTIINQISGGR